MDDFLEGAADGADCAVAELECEGVKGFEFGLGLDSGGGWTQGSP